VSWQINGFEDNFAAVILYAPLLTLVFVREPFKTGSVKNGKFVTLIPFQENRPKSMKPPQTKKRNFAFFRSIYLLTFSDY